MIRYTFTFGPEATMAFDVDEQGSEEPDPRAEPDDAELPEWLRLDAFTCERCALPLGSRRTCPAALAIEPVVDALEGRLSHDRVEMEVEQGEVRLHASISVQQAARSLIGLVLPLSSCPVLRKLRPMARLHLPLGQREHTAFRFLGMYLIAQHMRGARGLKPDWELEGLLDLLADIHMVNDRLAERVRTATAHDATLNALAVLDLFAGNVKLSVRDSLEELEPAFAPFLE